MGCWKLPHDGPEKTDQLSRDRDSGDLRLFPIGEVIIQLVQPVLCLPRVGDHRRRLSMLTRLEVRPHLGPMAITPRRLHEHVSTVTVSGLRDGAFAFTRARRVLA